MAFANAMIPAMNALGLALLFGHLSALLVVHLLLPNLGHLHAISGGNLSAVFLFRLLRLNIQIMKTNIVQLIEEEASLELSWLASCCQQTTKSISN